jgi:hypothetical protein
MMFLLARRIASGLLLLFSEKVQIGSFMPKEARPDLENCRSVACLSI